MAVEIRDKTQVSSEPSKFSEYQGRILSFEGINIQWERDKWEFHHPDLGPVIKPTYPLLNPSYRDEIVDRFKKGETAAVYMMGNYGVVKNLEASEWEDSKNGGSADALFDKVKKRPRQQNFVALAHPEDMIDIIDIDRLDGHFKRQFRSPHRREQLYVGPLHIIVPVKDRGLVNKALIREEDKTIAVFWAPHFAFEGLVASARRKIKHGMLGGGSLNIHGKDPCYIKKELYEEMARQEDWLEEIDFIVFDDIAEAANVGRSHTMVRFSGRQPELARLGSSSKERIEESTGHTIATPLNLKYASSTTPYSDESNAIADCKVKEVLLQVKRFELFLKSSLNSSVRR